jgi:hypothetical protein
MGFGEAVDEQGLEKAKGYSSIDGTARGEGHEQRIGAPRGSLHALRRPLDPGKPTLELGDTVGVGRGRGLRAHRGCGGRPLRGSGRGLNGGDAEKPRCLIVTGERPCGARSARDQQSERDQ